MADKRIVDLDPNVATVGGDIMEKSDSTGAATSKKVTLTQLSNFFQTSLAFVSSAGLSMPSGWSVAGTPITSSGTFTVTTAWQLNLSRAYFNVPAPAFNVSRQPSTTNDVNVTSSFSITNPTGQITTILAQVSPDDVTYSTVSNCGSAAVQGATPYSLYFKVPRGYHYKFTRSGPAVTTIGFVQELQD